MIQSTIISFRKNRCMIGWHECHLTALCLLYQLESELTSACSLLLPKHSQENIHRVHQRH